MIKRMLLLMAAVMLLVSLAAQPILSKNIRGGQTANETALDATSPGKTLRVSEAQIPPGAVLQKREEQQMTPLVSVRNPGIPTARNVDHVGITVPNLKEALTFFVDVLGAEVLWMETEGYGTQTPLDMKGIFNVNPRSSITLAQLRCGPNINVELLEYKAPDQNQQMPKNSDVNVPHLAFFVDDIDAATAYLQSKGVRMLSGPNKASKGPKTGQIMRYFLTPWGMSMEIVYRPANLPYEKDTPARLYGPAPSWR